MFTYLFVQVLMLVILTELLTELTVKSEIFKPLRKALSRKSSWLEKLFTCGYCVSVWAAFGVVFLTQTRLPLTGSMYLDLGLMALVVHRLSNILHNVIDKWTDKYYNIGYINTDKSGE